MTGRDSGFIRGLLFSQLQSGRLLPASPSQPWTPAAPKSQDKVCSSWENEQTQEQKKIKMSCNPCAQRDSWTPFTMLIWQFDFLPVCAYVHTHTHTHTRNGYSSDDTVDVNSISLNCSRTAGVFLALTLLAHFIYNMRHVLQFAFCY